MPEESTQPMRLTTTSYIVLGLLRFAGRGTPYDLKRAVATSVGNIWSVPHTQLYSEPERLARAGYVSVERELTGRRRKQYSLTDRGREAFDAWIAAPTEQLPELRDVGVLKLFFGARPGPIAKAQARAHRRKLGYYQELAEKIDPDDLGERGRSAWIAVQAGIMYEHAWIAFWSQHLDERDAAE